jgi:hypothetical protein
VDGASLSTGEKKLGGVSVHIKLVIRGDDFEAVINDILAEDGGSGLFVGIAEPTKSRVDAWH